MCLSSAFQGAAVQPFANHYLNSSGQVRWSRKKVEREQCRRTALGRDPRKVHLARISAPRRRLPRRARRGEPRCQRRGALSQRLSMACLGDQLPARNRKVWFNLSQRSPGKRSPPRTPAAPMPRSHRAHIRARGTGAATGVLYN
ncbi:hypothetical protein Y1Q_0006009 [Alligator mississippiensis]|uniref:Uncharacterized protein n=1 Tax=Alligator mississippiensis TaxID=8496 RepID=A0A151N3L8_ALLMI|nr:hypothetical protein Y1Q_0006009 [Alligator mississippiensis]